MRDVPVDNVLITTEVFYRGGSRELFGEGHHLCSSKKAEHKYNLVHNLHMELLYSSCRLYCTLSIINMYNIFLLGGLGARPENSYNRVFHYPMTVLLECLTVPLESIDIFDTAEELLLFFKIGDALTPQ